MTQPKLWTVLAVSAVAVSALTLAGFRAATTQPGGRDAPPPPRAFGHGHGWRSDDHGTHRAYGRPSWGGMHRNWDHGRAMMMRYGSRCRGGEHAAMFGRMRWGGFSHGPAPMGMMGPGSTMRTLMSALLGEHGQPPMMGRPGMMGHRMMPGQGMHGHGQKTYGKHGPPHMAHMDHGTHKTLHHKYGPSRDLLRRMMMGQMGRALVLRSQLDLTHEQRTKIRNILKDNRHALFQAMQPVMEKRMALQNLALTGASAKNINQAAAELGDAAGKAAVECSKIAAQIHKVLTPEQAKAVDTFLKSTMHAKVDFMKQMVRKHQEMKKTEHKPQKK